MPDFDKVGGNEADAGPLFRQQRANSEKWPRLWDLLTRGVSPDGKRRFRSELRITGGAQGLVVEFVDHNSEMAGIIGCNGLETLLDDVEAALWDKTPVGWREQESWLQSRERKKRRAAGLDKPVKSDKPTG